MQNLVYDAAHGLKLCDPAINFLLLLFREFLPAARRSRARKKPVKEMTHFL
jgi:hypothetical protein